MKTKKRIAIVDYGMGNLRSVEKALQKAGGNVVVTDSAAAVRSADAVVLPGVGAFGEAVKRLQANRVWVALGETLEKEKPFLGICLGLQLLLEKSEESPKIKGFGYFKGSVVRFQSSAKKPLKVPHIGWNTLDVKKKTASPWSKGVSKGDYFYFVHSFYPDPESNSAVFATSSYGRPFCSAMATPTLFASQFHPEKSGAQGLRLLKNFVDRLEAA